MNITKDNKSFKKGKKKFIKVLNNNIAIRKDMFNSLKSQTISTTNKKE